MDKMIYVERLLAHPEYRKLQKEIEQMEADRIYCKHEFSHGLDVCRIAWILFLEENALSENGTEKAHFLMGDGSQESGEQESGERESGERESDEQESEAQKCETELTRLPEWKERIYLTGLLHDIGRVAQYQTGEHHGEAGRKIAERLLAEIRCPDVWRNEILFVVALHFGRDGERMRPGSLGDYICRADHLSRNCFLCDASDTCKWLEEEKNKTITE